MPIPSPHLISTASCTLGELFSGHLVAEQGNGTMLTIRGRLNVPAYQRPYLWGTAELDKLIKDLAGHFKETKPERPDFYLGSVILHQQGDLLHIIDGQQRLTTMALIMAVAGDGNQLPELHFASPTSIQNIRYNFQYLTGKAPELAKFARHLQQEVNITLVITDHEDDAYTFFETQNTGGVRLSGVDIIKAYHLRAIATETERSRFAVRWEKQARLSHVCTLLLKARYWTTIDGRETPRRNHKQGLKKAIVREFSERTREGKTTDLGYVLARLQLDETGQPVLLPEFNYAIRQPLNNGANLIDYIVAYCDLFHQVLPYAGKEAPQRFSYADFIARMIGPVDGTLFTQELFEIAMLCYAHRFGKAQILEAALWIWRSAYSIRLSNEKMVKELSVPKFLGEFPLLDIILKAFDHEELTARLQEFGYLVDPRNTEKDTVKARYLSRIAGFFNIELPADSTKIDSAICTAITNCLSP